MKNGSLCEQGIISTVVVGWLRSETLTYMPCPPEDPPLPTELQPFMKNGSADFLSPVKNEEKSGVSSLNFHISVRGFPIDQYLPDQFFE